MFSHRDIWAALDRLTVHLSTSPSGLAKQAGLDPTTFNKSKRQSGSKDRWPSTESLSKAKVLGVVGMSFEDFARFADGMPHHGPAIPVIGLAQAGDEGFFDDSGFPKAAVGMMSASRACKAVASMRCKLRAILCHPFYAQAIKY